MEYFKMETWELLSYIKTVNDSQKVDYQIEKMRAAATVNVVRTPKSGIR